MNYWLPKEFSYDLAQALKDSAKDKTNMVMEQRQELKRQAKKWYENLVKEYSVVHLTASGELTGNPT